jgi:thiamine pyrophosphokinase
MTKKIMNHPSVWSTLIDFANYRSILCLNGDLPEKSFFTSHLPIIAADGAANSLVEMGVDPHIIIGDLDSVNAAAKEKYKTVYCPDQNFCDYEKALHYMRDNELLPSVVLGINGRNLDHILNNINIFLTSDCVLYAPPLIGCVVKEKQEKTLTLPLDTKVSLLGMPMATVTTIGLKWELKDSHLSFPGKNSCFNRSIRETIQIKVAKGCVLVLIYQSDEPTPQ